MDKVFQRKALKKATNLEWITRETPQPTESIRYSMSIFATLFYLFLDFQFYSIDKKLCQVLSSDTLSSVFILITVTCS